MRHILTVSNYFPLRFNNFEKDGVIEEVFLPWCISHAVNMTFCIDLSEISECFVRSIQSFAKVHFLPLLGAFVPRPRAVAGGSQLPVRECSYHTKSCLFCRDTPKRNMRAVQNGRFIPPKSFRARLQKGADEMSGPHLTPFATFHS